MTLKDVEGHFGCLNPFSTVFLGRCNILLTTSLRSLCRPTRKSQSVLLPEISTVLGLSKLKHFSRSRITCNYVQYKSGNISEKVQDTDVVTTEH